MFHSVWRLRPRSYEAHFTSQYVPKLWQFRETELGKKTFECRQVGRVSINVQTVHPEGPAVLAATSFFQKYSALAHVQTCGEKREQRSAKNEKHRRPDHVRSSLQFHPQRWQRLLFKGKQRNAVDLAEFCLGDIELVSLGHKVNPDSLVTAIGNQFRSLYSGRQRFHDNEFLDFPLLQEGQNVEGAKENR